MKLDKYLDKNGSHIEALYIHPISKKIYVRKSRVGRKELLKSIGHVNERVAKAMRDRIVSEWLGEDKPEELKGKKRFDVFKTVWIEKYIPHKEAQTNSYNTKKSLNTAGNTYLLPHFGDMHIQDFAKNGEELFQEFYSKYPVETSLYNAQKYLNNFLIYCRDILKIIPKKPKIALPPERARKTKKYKKDNRKVIPRRDCVLMARKAGAGSDLRLLILSGYRQGQRISEITSLRWSKGTQDGQKNWVEFKKAGVLIHLNETKTKMDRHIYADPMVARILKKRRESKKSDWVFPLEFDSSKGKRRQNFDSQWKAVRQEVGIKCVFHELRHTFLTNKFKDPNVAHILVCEYAGLSLKEAQETYLHFDQDDTRAVISGKTIWRV